MIIQPSSRELRAGLENYSYESVSRWSTFRTRSTWVAITRCRTAERIEGSSSCRSRPNQPVKTIQYLQEHRIKPEFMNHNWEGIMNVREWLIKPGILEKPYLMSMGPGMHNAAETYPDPWGHLYVLGMMKMIPEGSVIGISAGGRNWLPISVFAMLMGVDSVGSGSRQSGSVPAQGREVEDQRVGGEEDRHDRARTRARDRDAEGGPHDSRHSPGVTTRPLSPPVPRSIAAAVPWGREGSAGVVDGGPELVGRAYGFLDRTALVAPGGPLTYGELLAESAAVACGLLDGAADLGGRRVAFLAPPGPDWVITQWAIWRAGGVAVPLAVSHPRPELEHAIGDCGASLLVAHPEFADRLRPIAAARRRRFANTEALACAEPGPLPAIDPARRAMILYTSGTTGKPKGVVTTHATVAAQVTSLVEAWGWRHDDRIVNVLPLHHVHGIVNVVACALWSGAACEMLPGFDAGTTWERLASGEVTVFMAVPTVYARVIAAWEAADEAQRRRWSEGCRSLRLMVSGSAALPVATLERWRAITGHVLLERYGMTEIGMALSNPLEGPRIAGTVGTPLPGVEVRLVGEDGTAVAEGQPGEIEVRGPGVFREYWKQPEATRAAFRDGWFRTGDLAVVESGRYRILCRASVDLIKAGGYKISALEIEECLRFHPAVADCAVVGLADAEWGQRVAAAVVLRPGATADPAALQAWARERLAPYKVPREVRLVEQLPRNAMGKVFKPDVARLFEPGGDRSNQEVEPCR
jgi:malonyl-CoA/methylmalonyl-CoA synthetase